jgi:hypothetical protein
MWFYVTWIWAANQSPRFSDLYAPWWATHELLLHGRNPYTPAVAQEIQTVIYGAPIYSAYSGDPQAIGGGFAYPLFVVFLMAPTAWIPFPVVREIFFWSTPAIILLSLGLWLYALRWRIRPLELLTISVFALGSYPALQAMKLQNLSVVAACLVAGGLAGIVANRLILAGILLSIATFKPQCVVILIPWLALWTIGRWRERRWLAWSFLGGMALLLTSSEILLRGWTADFLKVVIAYRRYTYGHSLLDIWFSTHGEPFVAIAFWLVVMVLCSKYLLVSAQGMPFFLVCCLVLASTLVVIPTIEPHAQLLLLPCALVLVRCQNFIWESGRLHRLLFTAAACLLGWEWIAAFGLTLAAIWLPQRTLVGWWMLPLYTSPLVPLGMLLSCGFLLGNAKLSGTVVPLNHSR